MGETHQSKPVMMMAAVFGRDAASLQWARDRLGEFGDIALTSDPFVFDQTHYYDASMGADLRKQFHLISGLADPADLADWKLRTNAWESQLAGSGAHAEQRPVNIDPGYVTEAKLVLATTKDRDHRIYLRDNIYAEVTLYFHRGQWCSRPWTYPDYELPTTHAFLNASRECLRELLKQRKV